MQIVHRSENQTIPPLQNDPIRVLHVIDSLSPGGSERLLVELVNGFNPTYVSPYVCVTRQNMQLAEDIVSGVETYRLDRKRKFEWSKIVDFEKIIRSNRIEIIHAHGYGSYRFSTIVKMLRSLTIPIILHAHDSRPPDRVTQYLARKQGNHFIGVAKELMDWSRELMRFEPSHTTLLANAINPEKFLSASSIETDHLFSNKPRWIGLMIANVRPPKNFECLIEGVSKSCYRFEIGILVAGSIENRNYYHRCKTLIRELDLENNFVFLGSRMDIPDLVASSDFGILSSIRESGPIALLEYAAGNLPFVSTRVGEIGTIFYEAGVPGFVEPGDSQGIADALDALLTLSKTELTSRGLLGANILNERANLSDRISELQTLYRTLAN